MSVLACDRRGCDEIMCDDMLFGNEYYICKDCLRELELFRETWSEETRPSAVRGLVEGFMQTEPGTYRQDDEPSAEAVEDEFQRCIRRNVYDSQE